MSRSSKLPLALIFALLPGFAQAEDIPASEPQPLSSTVEEPLYVDSNIILERRQVMEIPAEGLQTVLVVDPSVAEARVLTDQNKVYIQAITVGRTYLHIWTSQGRKTVQIEVVSSLKKKEAAKHKKEGAFEVTYGLTSNAQTYEDKKNRRITRNNGYGYYARTQGKTPLGQNRTEVRYEQRNNKGDISSLRTNFQKGYGQVEAGDISSDFSQLTVPLTGSQGVHWNSPKTKALNFDALLGYKNKQLWGKQSFSQEAEQPFMGFKTAWKPGKKFEFFAAQSKTFQSNIPQVGENRGAGFSRKGENWALKTEGSQSDAGKAWFGDFEYRPGNSYFVFTQRSVDAGYVTINNGSWERGHNGQSGQAGFENLGAISLIDLRYDQFQNNYQQSNSNPTALNREMRGQVKLEQSWLKASQDIVLRDYPGVSSPSRATLYKTLLEAQMGQWRPRLGLRKEVNRYLEMGTRDYDDLGVETGLKVDPSKFLSYAASVETVASKNLFTGERRTFVNFTAGLRLNGTFWKPLRNLLSVDYKDQTQYLSINTKSINTQVRSEYQAGRGMSLYVAGQMENRLTSQNLGNTFSVNTGLEWTTNMRFLAMTARKVEGLVFKDLNGDGIRQKDEPGFEGVKIIMNDSKIQTTDSKGHFEFKPVKGEVKLAMATSALPANTKLASSNPQIYSESEDGKALKTLFAVAYKGEISGSIFMDANNNGVLDADDKPLKNASISLNGEKSEVTDPTGQFIFQGMAPGAYTLALNIFTLPANMILTSPNNIKVDLNEGEKKDIVFLIKPSRYVRGRVFWDKNANGIQDEREPGVGGIKMSAGATEGQSDNDGFYFLDNLKPGEFILNVNRAAMKNQWTETNGLPQKLTIAPDQGFVMEQNVPLRKIK